MELVLLLTGRGSIPLPTGVSVTILAVPAIIAGIVGGPAVGAVVGGAFGVASFARATTPLFHDPVIAIVPRVLIGIVAALAYSATRPIGSVPASAVAAALGAVTNTGLILLLGTLLSGPVGAPYLPTAVAWDVARTSIPYEVLVDVVVVVAIVVIWRALPISRAHDRRRR